MPSIPAHLDLRRFKVDNRLTTEGVADRLSTDGHRVAFHLVNRWIQSGRASATAIAFLEIRLPQVRDARLRELVAERFQARAAPAAAKAAPRRREARP